MQSHRYRNERVHYRTAGLGIVATLLATLLAPLTGAITRPGRASAAPVQAVGTIPTVPSQLQPYLPMNCEPGQVDLNHASSSDLETRLGVSAPVAQRIVDARPHDRVEDLLVVPGIGPGTLESIKASNRACSTPLTVPPPATDVCTTASQIDVNDPAAQPALAKLFGSPAAGRVVAAQPFPDLAHASTVLVAGAGPGKLSKYRSQLCATPAPKIFNAKAYAWVYTTAGGRADFEGGTLIVPPKVLNDGPGDWVVISRTPDEPLAHGPTFDMTVLGTPWSDGTKRVYVILPPDDFTPPSGSGTWIPTIIHGSVGAQEEYFGEGVAVQPDSRVAAAVTHLTPTQSLLQPQILFRLDTLTPGVDKSLVLAGLVKHAFLGDETPAPCNPDITDRTDAVHLDAAPTALLTGVWALERKVAAACAEGSLTADNVLVRFTNTSALAYDIQNGTYPMPADTQAVTYAPDVNLVTRALLDHRGNSAVRPGEDGSVPAYAQGTILTTSVPLGSDWSNYDFQYDGLLTSAVFITNSLGQIAEIGAISDFKTCVAEIGIHDFSASAVVGCAKAVANLAKDPEVVKKLAAVARVLDVFQDGRALSETLLVFISERIGSDKFEGVVAVKYTQTPKPNVDAAGRFIPAQCWTPVGGTWVVDEACYQNYLAGQSPPPASCSSGTFNPQCQPATNPGSPPDTSGCWAYDPLAGTSGAWVLDASAGQGCLQLHTLTFCGVGSCVPWPASSNHVIETGDGASYFVDARGGLWHLATRDAYFSCTAKFPILADPETFSGKWVLDNLNSYPYQGERYGC